MYDSISPARLMYMNGVLESCSSVNGQLLISLTRRGAARPAKTHQTRDGNII